MVKHFDHITIVVRDMESAKNFFGLLGFQHEQSCRNFRRQVLEIRGSRPD
jgi:catechol 2,3-dioxygenase-like lactoylglutathione lyase family enzyme